MGRGCDARLKEPFGVRPSVAIVVALGAGLLVAIITVVVAIGSPPAVFSFDRSAHEFFVTHRTPWLDSGFRFVTTLGSGPFAAVVVGLTVGLLLTRRHGRESAFLLAATIGASVLTSIMKSAIGRDRPALVDRLVTANGGSYPSGHSSQAMALYGALALITVSQVPSRRIRMAIGVAAAVLIASIGVSRLYLGVHWPTDVVGGWVLGVTWLATLLVLFALASSRGQRRNSA